MDSGHDNYFPNSLVTTFLKPRKSNSISVKEDFLLYKAGPYRIILNKGREIVTLKGN